MKCDTIMKVENLDINLKTENGHMNVVNDVSFNLYKGKVLGLIGESGCGKSITCLSLMGLLDKQKWKNTGNVILNGEKLNYENKEEIRNLRGSRISMIMQNPMSSFNPLFTIEHHFAETILTHKSVTKKEAREIAYEMLLKLNITQPDRILCQYPFQLSGGMLQRVMIAISLFMCPQVIIADEPTTALDVTVQYQILGELSYLKDKYKSAMLIVSHDLGVIAEMADEVAVMYSGYIVEKSSVEEIFHNPLHPYTKALMKSKPRFTKDRLNVITGYPSSIMNMRCGCPFYERCSSVQKNCNEYSMDIFSSGSNHSVRCMLYSSEKGLNKVAFS